MLEYSFLYMLLPMTTRLDTQSAAQRTSLERLAQRISQCRVCDDQKIQVRHSASAMFRGFGRLAIVVGIQPGNTEVENATAFSGAAGTRLMKWLVRAEVGRNREEICKRVYFTNLAECG